VIRVTIATDSDGLLRELRATGHANWARPGRDIVCAAATCLIRTTAAALAERQGVECRGGIADAELSLLVDRIPTELSAWVQGVTDVLTRGIGDLEREYPKSLRLTRRRYKSRERSQDALLVGG
jgi:hypothetical protein